MENRFKVKVVFKVDGNGFDIIYNNILDFLFLTNNVCMWIEYGE